MAVPGLSLQGSRRTSDLPSELFFSRSVVSDSLRPHGLQHARLPCPSQLPVSVGPLEYSAVGQTLGEMAVLEVDLLKGPQQAYLNVRQRMGLSKASKHLTSVCKFHSVILNCARPPVIPCDIQQ